MTNVNAKQESFLQNYVTDFNATRAYQETYGVKKNNLTARVTACKFLTKDNIAARLKEILAERAQATRIDGSYVVEYCKGAAELDLEEFAIIGKSGMELKEFKKIDKHTKKYLTEISMNESKTGKVMVNFKVFSKEKAIELLAKHTGVAKENVNHSGTIAVSSISDLVKNNS